jgi:hypothetical protein
MRLISVPDHPPALRPAITVMSTAYPRQDYGEHRCCPVLIDRRTMVTKTTPSPSPEEKVGQEDAGFFNQLIKSILEVSFPRSRIVPG